MRILVTGAAGFIGFHTSKSLLEAGIEVVGVDNCNDYYDVRLKYDRVSLLEKKRSFQFIEVDIADRVGMEALFGRYRFDRVIHLAAQAGVRYSIDNPHAYVDSNLVGHVNVLEGCRHHNVQHLVYASSSSVYGLNTAMPFRTSDSVDHPVSLYAATKKANELMSHTYSHLYGIPTTGLRFFTVYGPWGRPDMAPMKFAKAMFAGEPIDVYNHGNMKRDFTYIDDIVEGIVRIAERAPQSRLGLEPGSGSAGESSAPYRIYNIGAGQPVDLMKFIDAMERAIGIEAKKSMLPMQPGDVPATWADTDDLFVATGYRPQVGVEEGVGRFIEWYESYHKC
jgi:UDP-glucuronate 4-epimerase